jgi:hypothetical protein
VQFADDLTGSSLETLSGADVAVSVCSAYRVRTCAWLNAETSHVKCFSPERVQTVPDSIGNRRASRWICFQLFLQLAGVKNVKALDLARPSHHHDLRLPLAINIGEIVSRLIGIVREIGQPESFGSCVVSKQTDVDNDRCSDHRRKVATTLPLRHSCHRFAVSLPYHLSKSGDYTRRQRLAVAFFPISINSLARARTTLITEASSKISCSTGVTPCISSSSLFLACVSIRFNSSSSASFW